MNGDSTAMHDDVTLLAIWRSVLRGWRFIILITLIFLGLGVALTFMMPLKYSVSMRIAPPPSQNDASPSKLGSFSSLLGQGSDGSQNFNNFLALIDSNALAVELNKDPKIREIIYHKKAHNPAAISVQATIGYLKGHVTSLQQKSNSLLGVKGNQIVTLTANESSPQTAMYVLKHVVDTEDSILRKSEMRLTERKIKYLQKKLSNTSEASYRDDIISMISSETKKQMMIDTSDYYSFVELDYPVLIKKPYSPKIKINILISFLLGLSLSILFVVIRDVSLGKLK